jgi:integrase
VIAFDARAAKTLPPGQHLTFDAAPGLRLKASVSKRTWIYRFKSPVDDRMRQVRLGHWPAMSPTAALVAWQQARQLRDGGADPSIHRKTNKAEQQAHVESVRRQRARDAYSVRRLVQDYLASYEGTVVDKTYAELARLFGRELDSIADQAAATLTRSHAFELIDAMRNRPVVAQRLRQGLGAAWDHALDAGRVPAETPNWWRLVLRGKLPSRGKRIAGKNLGTAKRVLSEAEVAKLLAFLPNFSRDVEDALVLYLWTACRGAEIVAMERSEIAMEKGVLWWTIPVPKLKGRRHPVRTALRVPLVGRAAAVVRRRLAATDSNWLWPSVGKAAHVLQKAIGVAVWSHMPYAGTRPEWQRPRLTVTRWAPHDLRRTARTMLSSLGCPSEVGEAILGHMLPGVERIYNLHCYDAERVEWLQRLSERLEQLAKQS